MKIVILDGYAANPGDLDYHLLEQLGEVVVYPRTSDEEKVERAKDADIILLNKVQMDAETLAQLPNLKYIGIQATGFNVVDIAAAKKQGIIVTNIPAYSTDSVAQMTFALILAVTNRVEHYTQENRNERWAYNKDFCYWDTPLMVSSVWTFAPAPARALATFLNGFKRSARMDCLPPVIFSPCIVLSQMIPITL